MDKPGRKIIPFSEKQGDVIAEKIFSGEYDIFDLFPAPLDLILQDEPDEMKLKYDPLMVNYMNRKVTKFETDIAKSAFKSCYYETIVYPLYNAIENFENLRKKFDTDNLFRARIVAYMFSVFIRNCNGRNTAPLDQFFSRLGEEFDEAEYYRNDYRWIVPLSGSAYNDIRTNFVAHKVKSEKPVFGFEVMSECLDRIASQGIACIESKFENHFIIPCIEPYVDRDANAVEGLIKQFTPFVPDNRKEYNLYQTASTKILLRTLLHLDSKPWECFFKDSTFYSIGYSFAPSQIRGANATSMDDPDKIKCNNILDQGFEPVLIPDFIHSWMKQDFTWQFDRVELDEFLGDEFAAPVHNQCIYSILDRERLEIYEKTKKFSGKKKGSSDEITVSKKYLSELTEKVNKSEAYQKNTETARSRYEQTIKEYDNLIVKVDAQAARIDKLEKQLAKEKERCLNYETSMKNLKGENEELLKLVKMMEEENSEVNGIGDEFSEPLDTDIFEKVHIVCVGGHLSWAHAMKTLHKNIRIFDSDSPPPAEDVLIHADAIWLQVNSTSHSIYGKVTDIARKNSVPVVYFRYAGHVQCKRQLVEETHAMFPDL